MLHEGEHSQPFELPWKNWRVKAVDNDGGIIGRGSFSTVYRVVREDLGTTLEAALKYISIPKDEREYKEAYNVSFFSEEQAWNYYEAGLQKLQTEIELMYGLQGHSHIVNYQAHELEKKKHMPGYDVYIRMEKLKPLPQVLQEKENMSQDEVIKVGLDICDALKKVHGEKETLHRDIKLENIFYGKGEYKLGDFGVSRTLGHMDKVTTAGTPHYMAPEIYRRAVVSYSADIYSLGITLYRLLNGTRPPFLPADKSVQITPPQEDEAFIRRMNGEALPAIPGVQDNLMQVILKACAFQPEARYQSAQEMTWALESCREGGKRPQPEPQPIPAPEPRPNADPQPYVDPFVGGAADVTVVVPVTDDPAPDPVPDDPAPDPLPAPEPVPKTEPAPVPVPPVKPAKQKNPPKKPSVPIGAMFAVLVQVMKEIGAAIVKAARSAFGWCVALFAALGGLFKGKKKTPPVNLPPVDIGGGFDPSDPWGVKASLATDVPGGGASRKVVVVPDGSGIDWESSSRYVPSKRRFSLSPKLLKIGGIAVAVVTVAVLLILALGALGKQDAFVLRSKVEPDGGVVLKWDHQSKAAYYEVNGGVVDDTGNVEWQFLNRVEPEVDFYVSVEFVQAEQVAYRVTAVTKGGDEIVSNTIYVFPQGQ